MDEYSLKLQETFLNYLESIDKPNILEFGVRHGISTKMFIDICERKDGFLNSVDVDNYSKKFLSKKWKFIHGRDDNFQLVEKFISKNIDLIYLDSFHDAEHVEKIFFHYYSYLKKNGYFIIDDISWLPYSKKNERDNFNSEINNHETFQKILEIYNNNTKNFDLTFNFKSSGMAKIIKKNDNDLFVSKKIIIRKFTIKNFIRKIVRLFG
tara:strand:- start:145 stop:771 length:627 start_codon:yes stop_codon:yes gene_type:complete